MNPSNLTPADESRPTLNELHRRAFPRTPNARIHAIIYPRTAFGGEEFRLGLRGTGAVVQILKNGRWTDHRITPRAAYDDVAARWANPYDRNPALIAWCGQSEND